MRKIFYLAFCLFSSSFLSAQAPGGVAGSVLWLKSDAGAATSLWSDNSGGGNDFLQATPGNQPVLTSNVFNFYPALTFDGATSFLSQPAPVGFPTANSDRTIFVVANATNFTGYRWILVYGNVGFPGGTCQVGINGNLPKTAALATDFYANDFEFDNYWNTPANINGTMAAFSLNASVGSQYDHGLLLQSQSITGLSAPSANAVIGAINTGPGELWAGNIAEIIIFPTALSTADRNLVESYLAVKYGFTLGSTTTPLNYTASDGTTVYWTASATFQNDVFGIGADNGTGIVQDISNSSNSGAGDGTGQSVKGNLILGVTPGVLTDKQFLMIGNDAGPLSEHLIAAGEAPAIAVGSLRVERNWKVQNTGTVGPIDLMSFDVLDLGLTGGVTANNYRLMIDNDGDGDYNTGTQTFVAPVSFAGTRLTFTNLTLPNNVVFTVITQGTATLLPAVWRSFNVNLQNNNAILTWTTSDETDVDYYTIEYSLNGTSYTSLGNVAAKNSGGINTYTFSQDNLPAGTRFYRIRRVDKNRSYAFSQYLKVQVGGAITKLALYANPVTKDRIEYLVNVTQNQNAQIRVVDISGKILVQQNKGLSTGTNAITTNLPHIATGLYFLQVRLANETITKKFIKQ